MSRELIDEYIEKLDEDNEDIDLSKLVEEIVEYGFADENDLCKALELSSEALDELVARPTYMWHESREFTTCKIRLKKYLKKIRKSYDRLYYSTKS